jgi:hypothetical protein
MTQTSSTCQTYAAGALPCSPRMHGHTPLPGLGATGPRSTPASMHLSHFVRRLCTGMRVVATPTLTCRGGANRRQGTGTSTGSCTAPDDQFLPQCGQQCRRVPAAWDWGTAHIVLGGSPPMPSMGAGARAPT